MPRCLTATQSYQTTERANGRHSSGGEPLDYTPSVAPGDKVVVVTCDEDLSETSAASAAGVPVCSTELVLGEWGSYPNNHFVCVYVVRGGGPALVFVTPCRVEPL